MRRIKIKLPFNSADSEFRHKKLLEIARMLSNDNSFTIIEEKHLSQMSYLVILVENSYNEVN